MHSPEEATESRFFATGFLFFVSFFSSLGFSSLLSVAFTVVDMLAASLIGLDKVTAGDEFLPLVFAGELGGGGALFVATTGEAVVFKVRGCELVFCLGG